MRKCNANLALAIQVLALLTFRTSVSATTQLDGQIIGLRMGSIDYNPSVVDYARLSKRLPFISLCSEFKTISYSGPFHRRLRGGCNQPEQPSASIRSSAKRSRHSPKDALESRIRARKKLTNRVGRKLKRQWIGGAPMPKERLRHVVERMQGGRDNPTQEEQPAPTTKACSAVRGALESSGWRKASKRGRSGKR
jgi:hypothetical protein